MKMTLNKFSTIAFIIVPAIGLYGIVHNNGLIQLLAMVILAISGFWYLLS